MKWVTRENPKLDRIACVWLIRKFIDPEAEIRFVPEHRVYWVGKHEQAIAYDDAGTDYFVYKDQCLFALFLRKHPIADPALDVMAPIVKSIALNKPDPLPQAAGFRAIADGLAANFPRRRTDPPGHHLFRCHVRLGQ